MFYRSCILALIVTAVLAASEHRGTVTSAGLPIPGAVVTAVQGDRKLITSTDESGAYLFEDLSPGAWAIRIEAFGFEIAGKAVNLPADAAATWDLKLKLTSAKPAAAPEEAARHAAAAEAPKRAVSAQAAKATAPGNGSASFQRLAVNQTVQNDVLASLSEPMPDTPQAELSQNATESFLVTGSLSRGLQAPRQDDPGFGPGGFGGPFGIMGGQPGAQPGGAPPDGGGPQPGMGPGMRGGGPGMGGPGMMGGGRGPGGFGGGRGGFGGRGQRAAAGRGGPQRPDWQRRAGAMTFGNRSNRGRDSFRGSAFFTLRNSAFDARSYSLTGQTIDKPSYAQARFGLTGGGQLRIPKLFHSDKTFFFVNYFGTRSRNPFNAVSTLPSALERGGDFSQSIARGPVTVYDPTNSQPFAANLIPASRINSAAAGLLAYFPLPNLPGAVQNYQFNTSVPQNTDNFSLRMFHTLSRRDRIGGSFNLQSRGSQTAQMYGFRDTQSGRGQSLDLSWTRNIRPTLINSLRWNFSRNTSNTDPFFAYGVNVAAALGISGTSNEPRNYGPPNLSFTNFGALSDASAALMRNQSSVLGDGFTFIHGSNTLTVGVEYRRTQLNNRSDQNGRGTFIFSGIGTSGFDATGQPLPATGFDFADFLLGLPQSSSIRFGSADTYFRGSMYNAYLQDEWRVRPNLTLNAGLRYEYQPPLTEKYNRMANLDIAPGFTAVAPVLPDGTGPYSGVFPRGLINPDRNNLGPRIGVAWKPVPNNSWLVRAGYGWYYNSAVYNQTAARLAQQPPFASSASINTSLARPLTLEDGFAASPTASILNTYAVNRAYRIGYAQTWSFSMQHDLPIGMVAEVGYLGTKGTRLDIQRLPNRSAPGSPLTAEQRRQIGNATGFIFDSSEGSSIYHAAQARLSRRFRRGLSANLMYTFSKSIDNASSFGGGGGNVVAQDDQNLRAERGLSSFDRRHTLNLFYVLTSPAGAGGAPVRGFTGRLLKDWTLSGGIALNSGTPFTATVLGNRSDTSGTGVVGSARADATGIPLELAHAFFNPAAFTLPPNGRFGNAARNTIPGPTSFVLNAAVGRAIRLDESRHSLELRFETSNTLNTVNITRIGTTINASNYDLPLAAGSMRTAQAVLRFRF